MVSDVAIRVESVGKMYRIGSMQPYGRLSELLTRLGRSAISLPAKLLRQSKMQSAEATNSNNFWALRDLSFDVGAGEVLGVIGRNGAGKSTLLKILSRVTEPTTGRFGVRGRVSSLLEVGTGFHPELTGRENIFLSGSILGMKRDEIRRRFDEIVEFAEIGSFLDTPVKRYSSGMYVRLGFAIAAHLRPEILVVDEVLAVGDAAFQAKCLDKMKDAAGGGRTILFVSHNLGAVQQLCDRCVVLERGGMKFVGPPADAVEQYLSTTKTGTTGRSVEYASDPDKVICIRSARIVCPDKPDQAPFDIADGLQVHMRYEVRGDVHGTLISLRIDREGIPVFATFDTDQSPECFENRDPGVYDVVVELPRRFLKAGNYSISVGAGRSGIGPIDGEDNAITFEIEELSEDLTHFSYSRKRSGCVILPIQWRCHRLNDVESGKDGS